MNALALRNVLTDENPALRKVCRPYTEFNERLHQLLDDMRETMLEEDGVGLAAPQVGIIRRACVVLETNVGTIKSRISRGREKLREKISARSELFDRYGV